MNRATTIAELFDGTEVLVFGRKVPANEQFAEYNRLRCLHPRVHADYKELTIQEEHGEPKSISFAKSEVDSRPTEFQYRLAGYTGEYEKGFRIDPVFDAKLKQEQEAKELAEREAKAQADAKLKQEQEAKDKTAAKQKHK